MATLKHHIDPDPDTVIILRNPCIEFAPWEEASSGKKATLKETRTPAIIHGPGDWDSTRKVSKTQRKKMAKLYRNSGTVNSTTIPAQTSLFGGERAQDVNGAASTDAPSKSATTAVSDSAAEAENQKCEGNILYYVSSRHLMLASPWFRRALSKEKWAESERDEKDNLVHIKTDDWDGNAFLILMNIFHLKNRKVPREVSLDDLAKIAVLVDYYECAEAVEHFTEKWKEKLKTLVPIPSTYCRTLTLWIWIAWVLELTDELEKATLVAVKQCSEPMRTLGLPIPEKVSGKPSFYYNLSLISNTVTEAIDLKRYEAMEHVIESLHRLRENYLSLGYECPQGTTHSFDCGSALYGAISKEMLTIQILSPRPEIPFTGMSFEQLCSDIRDFKNFYTNGNDYHSGYYNGVRHENHDQCNLRTAVTEVIDSVVSTVTGFQLV